MRLTEQLCNYVKSPRWYGLTDTPGVRRFAKLTANRAMRRAAKRDPENAPRKHYYRGYTL